MTMTCQLKDAGATTQTPTVSVVITSYKSEPWIARALDSVLEQQVPFGVEIVVADDCSPDATVSVARQYEARFPHIVRVITRPENVGTQRNYYDAFEQSRGRYIAWLDADDYWTDPEKLALQVAALDADPTIVICGHFVRWVSRTSIDEIRRPRFPELRPGRHGMETVLRNNFLPSLSAVFRNGLHRELPSWYFDVSPLTDWPLWVVGAGKGDILLLDRMMADYTVDSASAFWGRGVKFWYEQTIVFYDHVPSIVPRRFHRQIRAEKGRRYEALAYLLRQQGEFAESRRAALKAVESPLLYDNFTSKTKCLAASLIREAQSKLRLVKPANSQ